MKATRTVIWKARDGKEVKVEITKTRSVYDEIIDGYHNVGKKTSETFELKVYIGGKFVADSYTPPSIVTPELYGNYKQMKAAGVYGHLAEKIYTNEENYNKVIVAIAELEAEVTGTEEFAQVKAQEDAREARKEAAAQAADEQYRLDIKNGMCPKCNSWCYGDCDAH